STNPAVATAVIDADGKASLTATANGTAGPYTGTAAATGAAGTAAVTPTNTRGGTATPSRGAFLGSNRNRPFAPNQQGPPPGTTLLTSTTTFGGGLYLFNGLSAGTYVIHEVQPSGITDGPEVLGSLGGTVVANDTFQVTLDGVNGSDYNFTEAGLAPTHGDSA